MGTAERFTSEEVAAALISARGLKSVAARYLNCQWNTIDRYVRAYKSCSDALKIARDGVTDLAEGKLFQAINNGEPWAIALYLRTVGKSRGYVERSELTGLGGGPVEFTEVVYELPKLPELLELPEDAE